MTSKETQTMNLSSETKAEAKDETKDETKDEAINFLIEDGAAFPVEEEPVSSAPCDVQLGMVITKGLDVFVKNLPHDRTNIFGVVIHHTDTNTARRARQVLSHKGLSTHIIIDEDGNAFLEHPLEENAAACVSYNKWMWQVDVVGRFEEDDCLRPSKKQLDTLKSIIRGLANERNIINAMSEDIKSNHDRMFERALPDKNDAHYNDILKATPFYVMMHGELRPTKCPGKYLIQEIEKIRDEEWS